MVDEETGEFGFFIGDYVEEFYVFSSNWKFWWVCDDFVFDGDRDGWIEEFDGDEYFSFFHWKIDVIF